MHVKYCDLLVVGSGASGLTAAITAKQAGLDVIVIEKDALYGGTTAFSGGMIWIPGNHHSEAANLKSGKTDSLETARQYILDEGKGFADERKVDAYLRYGKEMVAHLEDSTEVKFYTDGLSGLCVGAQRFAHTAWSVHTKLPDGQDGSTAEAVAQPTAANSFPRLGDWIECGDERVHACWQIAEVDGVCVEKTQRSLP